MALKSLFLLLASLLLFSTMVSSKNEELLKSGIIDELPQPSPSKSPPTPTAAPVKAPPPEPPIPVKTTPPVPSPQAPVPVKVSPPPSAPLVKPPVLVPPIKAPPLSPLPPTPPRNAKECYAPCLVRCKLHSRNNVCMRACVTCCDRCKCVPPGQYGNKEKCGKCYANMTTHDGRSKCP